MSAQRCGTDLMNALDGRGRGTGLHSRLGAALHPLGRKVRKCTGDSPAKVKRDEV